MIKATNIAVRYRSADRCALDHISFDISRGEYLAIIGPNGSGKSTLIKALCGFIPLESGSIEIMEKDVQHGGFGDDFFGEIGVVFQEPQGQFLARDVKTEIASILQNLGLSQSVQKARFDETVEDFGLSLLLNIKPENLSGGQMQLVNLACAVCIYPRLLLLDEPTTFLDPFNKNLFLSQITRLNKSGLTVVHITQYPDEALLAGRTIVLNSGQLVLDGPSQDVFNEDSILLENRLIQPGELSFENTFGFRLSDNSRLDSYLSNCIKTSGPAQYPGESQKTSPLLSIENLHFRHDKSGFELNINHLKLNRGEVIGLIGPGGSGKSTLAFLLAGLLKPQSGQICIDNKPIQGCSITELRQRIGITWQLPDLTLIGPTVLDDLNFGLDNPSGENCEITKILSYVGLDGFENRIVDTLSGGEKRKLTLASILLANPDFLVLDEPEAFLDPVSQMELAETVRKMPVDGKGMLIIAHDLCFLSETAQRIIGLANGKIIFDISAMQFFSDTSYLKKLGLPPNPIIQFREKLIRNGIKIKTNSLYPRKIKESLQ